MCQVGMLSTSLGSRQVDCVSSLVVLTASPKPCLSWTLALRVRHDDHVLCRSFRGPAHYQTRARCSNVRVLLETADIVSSEEDFYTKDASRPKSGLAFAIGLIRLNIPLVCSYCMGKISNESKRLTYLSEKLSHGIHSG